MGAVETQQGERDTQKIRLQLAAETPKDLLDPTKTYTAEKYYLKLFCRRPVTLEAYWLKLDSGFCVVHSFFSKLQ